MKTSKLGVDLYEEALRLCVKNKPKEAIRKMQQAIEAGHEPAVGALKEIAKTIVGSIEKVKSGEGKT